MPNIKKQIGIPPIPIPAGPAISNLSPPAATVGGAGFMLTVNGSGFVSASVVQWNQQPRETTFISSTQITASILATDISKVGSAAVMVVNPPGSNVVTFLIIPNITDIINTLNGIQQTFTTLQQFTAIQPSLIQALTDLKTYLTNQDANISSLQAQVSKLQGQVASLTTQNANLNTQVTQQNAQIAQLQAQIAAAKNQTASPLEVAQSLKTVVDQIQQAARNTPGVQTTLTNMNIQMRALVNVQRDTPTGPANAQLVFPDPTALPDANALSTVSFTFGAIPNLKAGTPASPARVPVAEPAAPPRPAEGVNVSSAPPVQPVPAPPKPQAAATAAETRKSSTTAPMPAPAKQKEKGSTRATEHKPGKGRR